MKIIFPSKFQKSLWGVHVLVLSAGSSIEATCKGSVCTNQLYQNVFDISGCSHKSYLILKEEYLVEKQYRKLGSDD